MSGGLLLSPAVRNHKQPLCWAARLALERARRTAPNTAAIHGVPFKGLTASFISAQKLEFSSGTGATKLEGKNDRVQHRFVSSCQRQGGSVGKSPLPRAEGRCYQLFSVWGLWLCFILCELFVLFFF